MRYRAAMPQMSDSWYLTGYTRMRYTVHMSRAGLIAAGVYVALCVYLIATQGLFGESFITIILGLPWSMLLAFFEYFNATGAVAYILAIIPLVLNAALIYWIAARLTRSD